MGKRLLPATCKIIKKKPSELKLVFISKPHFSSLNKNM